MTALDAATVLRSGHCPTCYATSRRPVPVTPGAQACHRHLLTDSAPRVGDGSRPAGPTGPGRRPRAGRRPFRDLTPVGQRHARAHALRARPGRFVRPRVRDVRVPDGYRLVDQLAAALAVLEDLPATAALRSDSLRTRRAVWRALCEHIHPDTGMAIASHARIAERAGQILGRTVGRSTAGNHLRALEAAGALHVALRGSSAAANGGDRNLASVYVVITPLVVDEEVRLSPEDQAALDALADRLASDTKPTTGEPVDELGHLPVGQAGSVLDFGTTARKTGDFSTDPGDPGPASPARRMDPAHYAPRTAAERRIAVAWLIAAMGWTYTDRAARELGIVTAKRFAHGWSPAAVQRAFLVDPTGHEWAGPLPEPRNRDRASRLRIRNLWPVLTWRLAQWVDAAGQPLPPPVPTVRPRRGRPPAPARPAAPAAGERPVDKQGPTEAYRARRAELDAIWASRAAQQRARVDQLRGQLRESTVVEPLREAQAPALGAVEPSGVDRSTVIAMRAVMRARLEKINRSGT